MPTNDLPGTGTVPGNDEALSYDEGIDALEDLLADPDEDPGSGANPAKTTPSKAKAEDNEDDNDADDDGDQSDDDDHEDEDEVEDEDEREDDDDPDGKALDIDDDTEFDLGDGRKATFAQLKEDFGNVQKRVADFQRHFTARTQEVAEYERRLQTAEEKVIAAANEVRQQRELIYAYAQKRMPQAPKQPELPPTQDPIAWMEYQQQKEAYEEHIGEVRRIQYAQQQEQEREKREREANMPKVIEAEVAKLHARYPKLADPEVATRTMNGLVKEFAEHYGITPQEISQVYDHRTMAVMLDAYAFRQLGQKKAKVEEKVRDKPKPRRVLRAGKRASSADQARHGSKARFERLRKTGSLEAAADSLMDFSDLFE